MRPLDLKVSLQNSYEASRSEAVRLEKPVALSHMANADAKRDQVAMDHMVNAPPQTQFSDDLFHNERDAGPDLTEQQKRNSDKNKKNAKGSLPVHETPPAAADTSGKGGADANESTDAHGFSTYA